MLMHLLIDVSGNVTESIEGNGDVLVLILVIWLIETTSEFCIGDFFYLS